MNWVFSTGWGFKMCNKISSHIVLFDDVPAGTIETLFNEENQPLLKGADLTNYLDIADIANNYKNLISRPREFQEAEKTDMKTHTENPV